MKQLRISLCVETGPAKSLLTGEPDDSGIDVFVHPSDVTETRKTGCGLVMYDRKDGDVFDEEAAVKIFRKLIQSFEAHCGPDGTKLAKII